jgi:hypothetical protein
MFLYTAGVDVPSVDALPERMADDDDAKRAGTHFNFPACLTIAYSSTTMCVRIPTSLAGVDVPSADAPPKRTADDAVSAGTHCVHIVMSLQVPTPKELNLHRSRRPDAMALFLIYTLLVVGIIRALL